MVQEHCFEQRLTELRTMWQGTTVPPLAEAAATVTWTVAADVDIASIPAQLDAVADELEQWAVAGGRSRPLSIEAVTEGFVALGFRGNTKDYYNPRNSFLYEVLTRRTGIPITLSVVFIELARRFGLRCEGVNFPGHFLVRYSGADGVGYLDPFHACTWLDKDGLQALLRRTRGPQARLTTEDVAPAGTQAIVLRMLRNVYSIAINAKDWTTALRALRMLLVVNPEDEQARRDIGLLYVQLERWGEALTWLEAQQRRAVSDAEWKALELHIIAAKTALARWN